MQFLIAWRNVLAKPVQNGLTVLVIAAAIAMMTVMTLLAEGLRQGLVRATEPFDLLVGAKGSPNQLVLNTVFLQDVPIGNIGHDVYEKLAADPLVAAAVPLAFGDSYNGHVLVGAGAGIFDYAPRAGDPAWLQLAEGRPFSQPFEAVLGAKTAGEQGLKTGDTFRSVHGLIPGGESHNHAYRVVGVLKPVNGPYDQAILVPIESIWQAHEHGQETGEAHEEQAGLEELENQATGHAVTAVMIKPKGYSEAMRLYQKFQRQTEAQMVFPAQVIVRLFAAFGQGEQVLKPLGYIIIGMGLLVMVLSVYWSSAARSRERAILRALGAGTRFLFIVILAEGALLTVAGVVIGALAGHGLYLLLTHFLAAKTALFLSGGFIAAEGYVLTAGLAAGILAGTVPALLMYRSEVARAL